MGTTETAKGNQRGKDDENEDTGDEGERRRGKRNKKGPGDVSCATDKFFFLSFYFLFFNNFLVTIDNKNDRTVGGGLVFLI